MARFEEQVQNAVRGRHPLIYVRTAEEERAVERLGAMLGQCFPGGTLTTWSCVRGLEPSLNGAAPDTKDPVAAIARLSAEARPGFCVMKDLTAFLGDPRVVRAVREAYFAFCREYKTCLVLVSPLPLPEALESEACYVELEVPTADELALALAEVEKAYPGSSLTATVRSQIVLALRGLTMKEAGHVLHRAFAGGAPKAKLLDEIFAEKQALAKKAGFLEFIPLKFDVSRVGGLENVKDWAAKRKGLFNQEAVKAGLPIPKGVLIMGVSGCGKSLLAKAIAGLWKVPLFRLDMSLIFSGAYGSPEAAFHRALRTIEGVAPVVLWIDEMEAALSAPKDVASPQSLTFSAFLTWMQEKPPLVFVAATANKIENLPAEILRKGRFDQVFFVDLPGKEEREQIINIHLELNGSRPGYLDMDRLVYRTEGWSGAEIEQAIVGARIEAQQEGRAMTFDDIRKQTDAMVPLSRTMAAQVKAIRDWAHNRATRASRLDSAVPLE